MASCLGALLVFNEHAAVPSIQHPSMADVLFPFLSVWYDGVLLDLNPDASVPTNNFLILVGSMNEDTILYIKVPLIPEANS